MKKAMRIKRQTWLLIMLLMGIGVFSFLIRWYNLKTYTTWWADDGGGHIAYVETILQKGKLPTSADTYLAWHDPLYYITLASWIKMGEWTDIGGLNWWEGLNIIFYFFFLAFVYGITYLVAKKNSWVALMNVFFCSVIFAGVKISAYINNEVLAQTLIAASIFLFIAFRLADPSRYFKTFLWAGVLGFATLTKLTAYVILFSAGMFWIIKTVKTKNWRYINYMAITLATVAIINLPWIYHKQKTFGAIFSINLYEKENRQDIMTSPGWKYIFSFNSDIFTHSPYWYSEPHSFISILLADTFGDYYNLFNNVDGINALPQAQKIPTENGRFTNTTLWNAMLWTNRTGGIIMIILLAGFFGWIYQSTVQKKIDGYKLFLVIALVGGWLALIYNNLRYPYLERGVLKAAFILFTYPLLAALSYDYLFRVIKNKVLGSFIIAIPIIIYVIVGWPILTVGEI